MRTLLLVAALAPLVAIGCSSGAGGGGVSSPEDIGEATAAITLVPANVGCLDLQIAAGARVLDQRFSVTPGKAATLVLQGLPLGNVVFSGFAYPVACASVTSSSVATWASDPTASLIAPGAPARVELAFHAAGTADVGIDFDDAGAQPLLTFSKTTLSFPILECGSTTQTTVVVTNQAAWPLNVTTLKTFMYWTTPSSFALAPGASTTLTVTEVDNPTETIDHGYQGAVTFTTDTPGDSPYFLPLGWEQEGAQLEFFPSSITAGQTVRLINNGSEAAQFSIPGAIPSTGTVYSALDTFITFPTAGTPVITFTGHLCGPAPTLTVLPAPIVLPPPKVIPGGQ